VADGAIDSVQRLAALNLRGVTGLPVLARNKTAYPVGRRLGMNGDRNANKKCEPNDVQDYLTTKLPMFQNELNTSSPPPVLVVEEHR
jgi:hypothetical protein